MTYIVMVIYILCMCLYCSEWSTYVATVHVLCARDLSPTVACGGQPRSSLSFTGYWSLTMHCHTYVTDVLYCVQVLSVYMGI